MNEKELETMRKSFNTVKNRSSKIDQSKINRLEKKVRSIKNESIKELDSLKEEAIKSFEKNGVEVIEAKDASIAREIILDLIDKSQSRVVAKSKSNTLGEINLKAFLKDNNVEVVETDLGDRILQLKKTDNKPVHPTGPASHLNVSQIADIVNESLDAEVDNVPREIMEVVKEDVLERLEKCEVGISGANVLAAEEGAILLVHNEGNISLVASKDLHIVVAGIDKFVDCLESAISIAKLETVYATGNYLTSYINVISGPSKTADIEKKLLKNMYGAERVVLILLDNGRSEIDNEALLCIGCGNCLIHCPVYNAVGNEFGFNNYLGGRGVAMSKFIEDNETCFNSGLYMCTLCGLCTMNCPVSIPTNEIIEMLRKNSANNGFYHKVHGNIKNNIKDHNSPY